MKPQELAQEVLDYLSAHPEKHNQQELFWNDENPPDFPATVQPMQCGTTMCIAGAALWIDNDRLPVFMDEGWQQRAGDLLGLNYRQQDALFYEYSNEVALDKLRHLAAGEEFDLEIVDNIGGEG